MEQGTPALMKIVTALAVLGLAVSGRALADGETSRTTTTTERKTDGDGAKTAVETKRTTTTTTRKTNGDGAKTTTDDQVEERRRRRRNDERREAHGREACHAEWEHRGEEGREDLAQGPRLANHAQDARRANDRARRAGERDQ